MPLEINPNYPSDLDETAPVNGDLKAEGDDQIRNIKRVLKTTLPNVTGAITPTHTELNRVGGVTSAIQTQLNEKAALASPALTGTPTAPTAAAGTSTTQIATTAFVAGAAFASALPAQTGNSGKFVTTDGTTASWAETLPSQAGNAGEYLTTDGTVASWAAVPAAAITLLATLTPTAAANVDALSTFSASYDNYLIIGQGLLPAADDFLLMRFANAGAADAGSKYYRRHTEAGTAITAASTSAAITEAGITVLAAGKGLTFAIQVLNVNDATNLKSVVGKATWQTNATPGFLMTGAHAVYNSANAASGVRFFWNGGSNFAATGSIRIYGYNNT